MQLEQFCQLLAANPQHTLQIQLPDQTLVPAHFHVTEVGHISKRFIDCGGTIRQVESCLLQIWVATDLEHRLLAGKLHQIIQLSRRILPAHDLPVEIEYEAGLITQFPLADVSVTSTGLVLQLGTKHTECLAPDRCGVDTSCCTPTQPAVQLVQLGQIAN